MPEERLYTLVVEAQQHVLSATELDRGKLADVLARVRRSLEFDAVAPVKPGTLDLDWLVRPVPRT